jgi:hypothetical protein
MELVQSVVNETLYYQIFKPTGFIGFDGYIKELYIYKNYYFI